MTDNPTDSVVTDAMVDAGLAVRLHDNSGRQIDSVLDPSEVQAIIEAAMSQASPLSRCPTCGASDKSEMIHCSDGFHAPGKTYWPDEASPLSDEVERVRQAIFDPGGVVGLRLPDEPLHHWQARAALTAMGGDNAQAAEIERLREALGFYAEAWEQDVDAERTVNGWEGSIGEIEPDAQLLQDAGRKARQALSLQIREG